MGRVSEEDVKVLSRVLSSLPGVWVRVTDKTLTSYFEEGGIGRNLVSKVCAELGGLLWKEGERSGLRFRFDPKGEAYDEISRRVLESLVEKNPKWEGKRVFTWGERVRKERASGKDKVGIDGVVPSKEASYLGVGVPVWFFMGNELMKGVISRVVVESWDGDRVRSVTYSVGVDVKGSDGVVRREDYVMDKFFLRKSDLIEWVKVKLSVL